VPNAACVLRYKLEVRTRSPLTVAVGQSMKLIPDLTAETHLIRHQQPGWSHPSTKPITAGYRLFGLVLEAVQTQEIMWFRPGRRVQRIGMVELSHTCFFVEDGGYDFLRWIKDVALYGGDTAYSQVIYEGSTSWAYVENEITGVHTSLYFETPDFNGHSAEWIYEAVDTPAGYRAGISTYFSGPQLTTMAGGGGLFWTYNTTKDIMNSNGKCSGGTVEGQPGPINENTSGFPVSS